MRPSGTERLLTAHRSTENAASPLHGSPARRGGVFLLDPSKRCEPSAYLFTRAVTFFLANGYTLAGNIDESDIILVNSCCVTEDKIASSRAALAFAAERAQGKRLVLFGCMAGLPLTDLKQEGLIRIGPGDLAELGRHFPHEVPVDRVAVHRLPLAFYEPGQGLGHQDYFVMIAQGCSNRCSYCNIRRVKGRVRSRPAEAILAEIQAGIALGAESFVLLADDCGSYGHDRGTDLASLLEGLGAAGEGFRVKLGYLFPRFVLSHFDRLRKVFETGRIAYVNIPVQSGSQRILDLMNRRYAAGEVRDAVRRLQAAAPQTRFCTHIMVNFPTESEGDFLESLAIADAFETVLFLNYSDNRGTAAAGLFPKVGEREARRRLDMASDYVNRRGRGSGAVISDFDCDLPYNLSREARD